MSDCCSGKKSRIALLASVAVNIFLVAFTLGRVSGHPMLYPGMGPHGMLVQGMHEGPPPGFAPPMFGPDALFDPTEVRADEARMHENFDKMDGLRKEFAAQLKAGPVSKEAVLKHFADIGQVMDGIQKEAQEKAADKISTMSDADRLKFAQTLERHSRGPEGRGEPSDDRNPQAAPPLENQRPPASDSINR